MTTPASTLARRVARRYWRSSRSGETTVYEPGEEGWIIASIPEIAGVFSQGHTQAEARVNVIDALRLMLSSEPGDADADVSARRCT